MNYKVQKNEVVTSYFRSEESYIAVKQLMIYRYDAKNIYKNIDELKNAVRTMMLTDKFIQKYNCIQNCTEKSVLLFVSL
jgi:hypothetical protein